MELEANLISASSATDGALKLGHDVWTRKKNGKLNLLKVKAIGLPKRLLSFAHCPSPPLRSIVICCVAPYIRSLYHSSDNDLCSSSLMQDGLSLGGNLPWTVHENRRMTRCCRASFQGSRVDDAVGDQLWSGWIWGK